MWNPFHTQKLAERYKSTLSPLPLPVQKLALFIEHIIAVADGHIYILAFFAPYWHMYAHTLPELRAQVIRKLLHLVRQYVYYEFIRKLRHIRVRLLYVAAHYFVVGRVLLNFHVGVLSAHDLAAPYK